MRIGYIISRNNEEKMLLVCDQVKVVPIEEHSSKNFVSFVEKNSENDLYINTLEDLELQLSQLFPAFELLINNGKVLHLIDKKEFAHLSDKDYFKIIYDLSLNEMRIMKARTQKGVDIAKEKGIIAGRPKISKEVVKEIRTLYIKKHKTIREIAGITNVSIGTAYKYATKD